MGLAAGALHVVSGPDHLAAVAPLSVVRGGRPWILGLRWGLGHAAGVLAVGAALILLRGALDLHALAIWAEKPVGLALILVGLWGLHRARSRWVHVHAHAHAPGGPPHIHIHAHRRGTDSDHERTPHHHEHTAFWFGTLHGFAGSAHLLGVLPALALPSRAAAIAYLLGFGAGAAGAMMTFAHGLGIAATRLAPPSRWGERAYRVLLGGTSAAALLVGVVWLLTA
jgi:hypothetical protein